MAFILDFDKFKYIQTIHQWNLRKEQLVERNKNNIKNNAGWTIKC